MAKAEHCCLCMAELTPETARYMVDDDGIVWPLCPKCNKEVQP